MKMSNFNIYTDGACSGNPGKGGWGAVLRYGQSERELSGGEKRRLAIASIIAMGFETIILDEPYSNMDYNGVKSVNRIIRSLHNEGKTIVILSHEIEKCLGMADRFVVLYNGKIEYNAGSENISKLPLEKWGIKNPLNACLSVNSLVWE